MHSGERLADEDLGQVGVGQALGDAHHVVVELVLGVAAHLDGCHLGGGHVGDYGLDVLDAVEGEADDAAGEVGVAAAEVLRGFFHHQHGLAAFFGGDGRAEGRVSRADYYDVIRVWHDEPPQAVACLECGERTLGYWDCFYAFQALHVPAV